MRTLFRFVAIALGIVVVLVGAFGAWAFATANARYEKQWGPIRPGSPYRSHSHPKPAQA